jgi:glycosyltransferase involved in cell wall biosynthesis
MKVAFYSPIKPPDHPVPSGDRLMARLLIRALELGGADVDIVSTLRSFRKEPPQDGLAALIGEADAELVRIADGWSQNGAPDLFVSYHPYYKAPDLIGPELAHRFSIPYVTVEASYSRRRNEGGWRAMQALVATSVESAAVNISMTERDREGLLGNFPTARSALLPPFLDVSPFVTRPAVPEHGRLITVAMMRPGDKFDSFRMLAQALALIGDTDWTLSIIGDGPARPEVEALFSGFDSARIAWLGQLDQADIAERLASAGIYVWPGCGEAYGLAYLEAQAAGLPVVAQAIAGVPDVVIDGRTGLLTPADDVSAYAVAIRRLVSDDGERQRLARGARSFVQGERSLPSASRRLMSIIREFTGLTA